MLEQYESRFAQIRSFIEQKEFEIQELTSELHKMQSANVDMQENQQKLKGVLKEHEDVAKQRLAELQ